MSFFIIDLTGVILTSLTDSLMYGSKGGVMTSTLTGVAVVAIPLIVVLNVVAGFIYHMTSPETKVRRSARKAAAEHKRKMGEINEMERDLIYAEQYLLAKQETLDKATILAEIKTAQDAVEKATRAKLRDQLGIQQNANTLKANETGDDKLASLKSHLADLRNKLGAIVPQTEDKEDTAETLAPAEQKEDIAQWPEAVLPGAPSADAVKGNGHSPH